jgi:hypothetical protein
MRNNNMYKKKTMRLFTLALSIVYGLNICAQLTYQELPVLKARTVQADYRIGNDWIKGRWIISPQIESDSLFITCHSHHEDFAFYTDSDSISFYLLPGKIHKFYISINDTAYALTVVKGIKPMQLHFDTNKNNNDLKFCYETNDKNSYLDQLRSNYPIDSLVKNKNSDTEKAMKILHWVHNQWQHDGSNEPGNHDAISILNEVKEGKNFRCVEYGIVAAACLNAVGLKSRILGLMIKEVETTKYGAGHVLLEVYLNDLKKWALLDGQWDVIPMVNNIPLNAVEFQKTITDNYKSLEIRTSSGISKRNYVDWVCPYLYYFTIPFDNREGTNLKTKKINGKSHLMLVPLGAKVPAYFQIKNKIDYCIYTNALNDFYAPPQNFE